jgi:hypothetical protein
MIIKKTGKKIGIMIIHPDITNGKIDIITIEIGDIIQDIWIMIFGLMDIGIGTRTSTSTHTQM